VSEWTADPTLFQRRSVELNLSYSTIDYPCRPAGRFQNISSLTIFVVSNYDDSGESATEITYIGLKGKGKSVKRVAVETVYEAQGMRKDHKVKGEFAGQSFV
jgi:PITH domain